MMEQRKEGIDGSARKPALLQDTDYMVDKTYKVVPCYGLFGAYLMPQWPIQGLKLVSINQNHRWNMAVEMWTMMS